MSSSESTSQVKSDVPQEVVNKSILIDRNVKRLDSNKKLHIQERIPFMDDEDGGSGEVQVNMSPRRHREMVVTRIPTKVELKTLTHLAKRPAVDIEFQDLTYNVRNPNTKGTRTILKSINGKFRAGELTAILGPSGSGKTTLLNILAGYVSSGVSGEIKTNGHPRQMKLFNKLSSYIMQEDLIMPLLTVQEAMEVAANLKLGRELKPEDKRVAVEEVLRTLGLISCRNTRTDRISGGQRRRLSLALELVSNPPVIFLDEPTTGLDIVSIKQLLDLLKLLAQQGRTIICTVHQPSATHFKMFDNVYILSKGQCVYNGASKQLIPFLDGVGLQCPKHYNPADFVLEMIQEEFTDNARILSEQIQNGKLSIKAEPMTLDELDAEDNKGLTKICRQETVAVMPAVFSHSLMDSKEINAEFEFPTSFTEQFWILLKRLFLQQSRNSIALGIQLFHHLFSAILVGIIFNQVGQDATRPFTNMKFCMSVLVFFLYTHIMTPVLLFPTAIKLMQREFFNRWYGLKAYYAAVSVASLPLMIVFGSFFCAISYIMSSQPLELSRFLWWFTSCIALGVVSEGHGLIVGSIFSVTNGCIVAPASFSPLLALGVYGMGHGEAIEKYMSFLMGMSYLRFGLVGITNSLYGHDREVMECHDNEISYCHYKDPKLLLRDLGMSNVATWEQILALLGFAVMYRVIAFLLLRYRLTSEFSNQVLNYVAKIMRHK